MRSRTLWACLVAFVALFAVLAASAADAAAQTHPRLAKKGRYKIKIDSAPPGATVYIDKKELGPVGVTPWQATVLNGDYLIILELEGYQPAQRAIKVARTRTLQETFIPLIKKLDPPRIDVRADADKNIFGATVFLDGQNQGQAPVLLTTTPGRHLVEIKKDGFEPFSTWVEAKENEKVTLTPFLKEVVKARTGTLVVDADVPDAEVFLDGNKLPGTTPVFITDVIEGLHVVEVRKEPAIPWKQTVQVIAGTQAKVRAELKATIGGQGGVIRVLSNVAGAKVFLDGTEMGAVPVDIKDVKTGEHVLEVKAPGYQSREERVTVNAGQSIILKLDLNPEAGKGDTGTLKVVSAVPDADVFIDGAAIGKVPQEKAVTRGDHFVVVKLAGYKTFEQKVRIEPGQTLTVSADLRAVARLRVISDPAGAEVLVNGLPQGVTPLELTEVEVGTTIVRVIKGGYQVWEQTLTLEGGKAEILNANLKLEGMSDDELAAEQRGLASFGARTLPRGRSTVDMGIGYPYFLETRINVGAGKMANFGFDAGVGVRTMGSRSEIGMGVRLMMVDRDPFSAGVFGDLWWGSRLIDDSKRNGLTLNAGAVASLTAFTRVTVSGRLYLNIWSDRHCPGVEGTGFEGNADAIDTCDGYLAVVTGMGTPLSAEERMRVESLTGQSGNDFFTRETGLRLMSSVIAEVAIKQRWNVWFVLEGAPFQGERALYTDSFSAPLLDSDFGTYGRVGATYKF
ncbi:MAG: PEGA domain-containing protein [Kofleriaceae bacterium]|nr:PEGA domain-containing protein [Kofleriaceae bacterium]MCL4226721.1 PEGA domain-containing protein [Myxococcales bacterium]